MGGDATQATPHPRGPDVPGGPAQYYLTGTWTVRLGCRSGRFEKAVRLPIKQETTGQRLVKHLVCQSRAKVTTKEFLTVVVAASFGGRIQAARTRQGLTRRALAERAGLSQGVLARVETQSRAVSVPELLKIASALGTTLGDLIGTSPVRDRLTFSYHSGDEALADAIRERLSYYLELDAHFDDLGLAATV